MTIARIAAIALTLTIAAAFTADASAGGKGKYYGGSSSSYGQQQYSQFSGKQHSSQFSYGGQSSYKTKQSYGQSQYSQYSQSQFTPSYSKQRTPGKYSNYQSYGGGYQGNYGGGFQHQHNCLPKKRPGKVAPLPYYTY